jgi:hypothetical protein
VPQTINAASFAIVDAVSKARDIPVTGAVDIVLGKRPLPVKSFIVLLDVELLKLTTSGHEEQLRDLHIGQSYDIHWTRHSSCPSETEYLEMVAKSMSSAITYYCLLRLFAVC